MTLLMPNLWHVWILFLHLASVMFMHGGDHLRVIRNSTKFHTHVYGGAGTSQSPGEQLTRTPPKH
jgi:hypothetical protein